MIIAQWVPRSGGGRFKLTERVKNLNGPPPIMLRCPTSLLLDHKHCCLCQFCVISPSFSSLFASSLKCNLLFWLREKQVHLSSGLGRKKPKQFRFIQFVFSKWAWWKRGAAPLNSVSQSNSPKQDFFPPHRKRKQYVFIYSEHEQA